MGIKEKLSALKRGQGSFEYILLLAGVLLIVVLAVVLLRGSGSTSSEPAAWQACKIQLAQSSACYNNGAWRIANGPLGSSAPACNNWAGSYSTYGTQITGSCTITTGDRSYNKTVSGLLDSVCCGTPQTG